MQKKHILHQCPFFLSQILSVPLFFSQFFFDQKQSTLDLQIWDKYVLKYQIIQVLNPSKINVIPNNDKNWRSKVLKSYCPYYFYTLSNLVL